MDPSAPVAAPRLKAPSWRDPRLVVGVLLVLASVVAGGRLAAAADTSVRVWAARATLASGDTVGVQDLVAVRVGLRESAPRYLSADQAPPRDLVALRTVGAGELVPASSVGEASALALTPLGLPYEGEPPRGLVEGSMVDVWLTPAAPSAAAAAQGADEAVVPTVLARRAEVTEVAAPSGFTASRSTTVSVALTQDQVEQVLAARASGAQTTVLLVPGSSPARP